MLTRKELIAPFFAGETAAADRLIGTEYEALVRSCATGQTVTYDGPGGIERILRHLADDFGWDPVDEHGHVIALTQDGKSITLEPGGQFEMSGAPVRTLTETEAELKKHLEEIESIEDRFPVRVHWRGLNPWQTPEQISWMPKDRYRIMRQYLPTRGRYGIHMMGLTCTVQANLDCRDQPGFAKRLRTTTALGALVNALFANSPLLGGEPSGFQSFRAHIWTSVDPDRCFLQRFVFETDAGYEDYVNWALEVPLFFVKRDGKYVDLAGKARFLDLMEGRVEGLHATEADWQLHLSTLFPEVRARPHLEFRSCDVVPPEAICACPALWKGLVYDDGALDAAWDLVKKLSFSQRIQLAQDVAKDAIRARRPQGAGTVGDLCRDLLAIATEGLSRQAARGLGDAGDARFLAPLLEVVDTGRTFADRALEER